MVFRKELFSNFHLVVLVAFVVLVISSMKHKQSQEQILAVWILAAKLPNSDLKLEGDFPVFLPRKTAPQKKNPPKIPQTIHPGICSAKFPSDFCNPLPALRKLRGPKRLLGKRPFKGGFRHKYHERSFRAHFKGGMAERGGGFAFACQYI